MKLCPKCYQNMTWYMTYRCGQPICGYHCNHCGYDTVNNAQLYTSDRTTSPSTQIKINNIQFDEDINVPNKEKTMKQNGNMILTYGAGILEYDGLLDSLLDNGYTIVINKIGEYYYIEYQINEHQNKIINEYTKS